MIALVDTVPSTTQQFSETVTIIFVEYVVHYWVNHRVKERELFGKPVEKAR